jgi:alpha-D-ribose 1-methylphosphonate 5-triphosphate synthase subunit PhnL
MQHQSAAARILTETGATFATRSLATKFQLEGRGVANASVRRNTVKYVVLLLPETPRLTALDVAIARSVAVLDDLTASQYWRPLSKVKSKLWNL